MDTTTGKQERCKGKNRDGAPCGSWAVNGSEFCIAHDPPSAGRIAAARRKGGAARHGREIGATGDAERVTLAGPGDVLRVIESEVNTLLQLETSISRARAVGYLCGVFVATWESSELEGRLSALETRLANGNG